MRVVKQGFVSLYVGVTSDLVRRIHEHKAKTVEGFTQKYGLERLVYFEVHESIEAAILREKHMKEWKRDWKIARIEQHNPDWFDLYSSIL
ncbi:MAG: GIY-YIG nuclease family protein [Proteobacteria bacterium]|nr:GIY-YIG nuclease family protein [Pseudomonadota bacterium]